MLLQGCGGMAITLTLAGHAVPLLLAQLGHAIGLRAGLGILHTILATVRGGLAAGAGAGLGAQALARSGGVELHGIGILGGAAGEGAAAGAGLLASAGNDVGGVDAELVEGVVHLGQGDAGLCAGDDGAVLEALLHAGLVADKGLLLADDLGLREDGRLLLVVDLLVRVVEALRLELGLLLLERRKLGLDFRVHVVGHVHAVQDLGDIVVLPLGVLEEVVLAEIDVEHARAALLGLDVAREPDALRVVLVVLLAVLDGLWDKRLESSAAHGLRDVDPLHDVGKTAADLTRGGRAGLELLRDTLGDEALAGGILDLLHAFLGVAGHLEQLDLSGLEKALDECLALGLEVLGLLDINLVG